MAFASFFALRLGLGGHAFLDIPAGDRVDTVLAIATVAFAVLSVIITFTTVMSTRHAAEYRSMTD